MDKPLKAVFDTQIFLRMLINPNSLPAKLAPTLWIGAYELFLSEELEAEILDVVNRPRIRMKFPQITDGVVKKLVEILRESGHRVIVAEVESVSRDPKDDKFLACAKTAHADYLVSEDQDLLVLKSYAGTRIIDSAEFLQVLQERAKQADSESLEVDDPES